MVRRWVGRGAQQAPAWPLLAGVELIAATDVEHPLLGPMGAATVFGPQKGADPDTVRVLEQRRARRSAMSRGQAPREASARRCWRWAPRIRSAVIAEHTRLADDVAAAQLVITGEVGSTTSRCAAKW
jgi:glycerate kinase